MNIAFISLYTAFPATSGAASVTSNCAQLTPGTGVLIQLADKDCTERVSGITVVSIRQRGSSRLSKFLSMPFIFWKIQRSLAECEPTHIVLEGASWAVYLWLLAVILKATLPATLVYHAHNVEYLLRRERESPLIASVTRYFERHLLKACKQCFAVSHEDRDNFARLYGVRPSILPNCIASEDCLTSAKEIDIVKAKFGITNKAIIFMGLYSYPPNKEAVRFLIDQVMPPIYKKHPDIRLVVTGGNLPDSYPWLIKTGVIPKSELNAVLGASRIGVSPIFRGSGTRLKILEYMAAGLPVVTTRKGAEGLSIEADGHALFAEDAEEFQNALSRLLSDPELRRRLCIEGQRLVRSRFEWIPVLKNFSSQIDLDS